MGSTCDRMVRDASTTRAISRASPLPVFLFSALSSSPPEAEPALASRRSAVTDLATAATTSGSRPATSVAASAPGDPGSPRSLPNAAASAPEKSACDRPSSENTALRFSSARTSGGRSCAT